METKGIAYWVLFVANLQEWLQLAPRELNVEDLLLDIENVSYEDLGAISEHFEAQHEPEDYKHRQQVVVELTNTLELTFFSPARAFVYVE